MSLLDSIKPFVDAGCAVHWLHARRKNPIGEGWQEAPVATLDRLARTYRDDNNVGVRLGEVSRVAGYYLHVIDMDIRLASEAPEAWAALREILPQIAESFPTVQSGSGGESRHIYFLTDRPFQSRKLVTSGVKIDGIGGKRQWTWEIDLFGTGKQVVMPPSIHPDTGKPYSWVRPFDFDSLDFDPPFIPADTVAAAGAKEDVTEPYDGEGEDILTDITDDDVRKTLLKLHDRRWDYDHWYQMGMALHHQYRAGKAGLDIWEEVSSQKPGYKKGETAKKWRSFKVATKRRPVRFATVMSWAGEDSEQARYALAFDEFDDVDDESETDDFDTLLTETPAATSDNDWDGGPDEPETENKLAWKSLLDLTDEGGIRPTLHNLRLIVENDIRTRGVVAFNEFTQEIVQLGKPGVKDPKRKNQAKPFCQLTGPSWTLLDKVNGDFWTEDKDNAIRAIIEAPKTQGGYGFKVPDRDLRAAIDIVGRLNGFHPVRSYLAGLEWDGVPRVERLFVDYLGAPDDAYTRAVGRLMMIAGVARVHEPGSKFDFAVILQGLQGRRKSTFISVLAKSWFSELEGDFEDSKAMVEAMQGAWILEMPELGGFVRADVRHIKAFVSRRSDKVRLAYAKRAQEYHRQCIFIGSTNDDKFLKDDSGNRRFWPIRCTVDSIDTDKLAGEVDQLWAEALHLYRAMRKAQPTGWLPLYLTDADAQSIAARLQESARVESADDAVAGQIAAWLEKSIVSGSMDDDFDENGQPVYRNETCLVEIWVDCLGKDRGTYDQQKAQMLGRAMSKIGGWAADGRIADFPKFGRQRVYDRGGYAGHLERS